MRFHERTLARVLIVPKGTAVDALGAVREVFDVAEGIPARGSLKPVANALGHAANALADEPFGQRAPQTRKLLLSKGAPLLVGDGVRLPGEEDVNWVCEAIDTWSGHIEARLIRRV